MASFLRKTGSLRGTKGEKSVYLEKRSYTNLRCQIATRSDNAHDFRAIAKSSGDTILFKQGKYDTRHHRLSAIRINSERASRDTLSTYTEVHGKLLDILVFAWF